MNIDMGDANFSRIEHSTNYQILYKRTFVNPP